MRARRGTFINFIKVTRSLCSCDPSLQNNESEKKMVHFFGLYQITLFFNEFFLWRKPIRALDSPSLLVIHFNEVLWTSFRLNMCVRVRHIQFLWILFGEILTLSNFRFFFTIHIFFSLNFRTSLCALLISVLGMPILPKQEIVNDCPPSPHLPTPQTLVPMLHETSWFVLSAIMSAFFSKSKLGDDTRGLGSSSD